MNPTIIAAVATIIVGITQIPSFASNDQPDTSSSQPAKNSDTLIVGKLEQDLEKEQDKYKAEFNAHEATKTLLDIQKDNNEKLKIPFHNITIQN